MRHAIKHHPSILTARRLYWVTCACGWRGSYHWTASAGAELEFGAHLVSVEELDWAETYRRPRAD